MFIHLFARFYGDKKVTAPVTVERAKQTLDLDHFPQPGHHRACRFLFHQLRVVNLTGGIVQNHNQIVPALVAKPLVLAAVNMQQHPRYGPPLAPPAMLASLAPPGHQPGPLQRLLHERVAQLNLMLLFELLVKVPHIEIEVFLAIEPQHLFHLLHRHPLITRPRLAPIHQTRLAVGLQPLAPPPHRPVCYPNDFRRLLPGNLLRQRFQ
jgi:hypothetical protein